MIKRWTSNHNEFFLITQLCLIHLVVFAAPETYANIVYRYDQAGRLALATDDTGNAIIYSYDSNGNVISITRTASENLGPPVLTGINPEIVNQGETVDLAISGTNLLGGNLTIDNPGISVNGIVITETTVKAALTVSPNAPLIPTTLTVGNIFGSDSFAISTKGPRPKIINIFPFSGTSIGGTPVSIFGEHFTIGSTITIGDNPASNVVFVSDILMQAVTPPGTPDIPADVTVSNDNGGNALFDGFSYTFAFTIPAAISMKPGETNVIVVELSEPASKELVLSISNAGPSVVTVPNSVIMHKDADSAEISISSLIVGTTTLTFTLEKENKSTMVIVEDLAVDTDIDGLTDATEALLGTDPNTADTDGDGLLDGEEVNTYRTNPLDTDTDGDGINDKTEISSGADPADRFSFPAITGTVFAQRHFSILLPEPTEQSATGQTFAHSNFSVLLPRSTKQAVTGQFFGKDQLSILLPQQADERVSGAAFVNNQISVLLEAGSQQIARPAFARSGLSVVLPLSSGRTVSGELFAKDQLSLLLPLATSGGSLTGKSFSEDHLSVFLAPSTNQLTNEASFVQNQLSVLIQE